MKLSYNLYQKKGVRKSLGVVEYFNSITTKTKLTNAGEIPLSFTGERPYTANSIADWPAVLVDEKRPAIILVSAPFESPLQIKSNFAVVSDTPFLGENNARFVQPLHYWTYFCAISLLKLESMRNLTNKPKNWKVTEPKVLESIIKQGSLLSPEYEELESLFVENPSLIDLNEDIKSVLTAIATSYKNTGGRVTHGVDLVYADPEKRGQELEPYKLLLKKKLKDSLNEVGKAFFETAWNTLVEADASVSKSFMNSVELDGPYYIVENFLKTLGEAKSQIAIAFLLTFDSDQELDDNLRKISRESIEFIHAAHPHLKRDVKINIEDPIEHGQERLNAEETIESSADIGKVEKIDEAKQIEPETIGTAPPAGVTEDKRPKDALGYKVFANALGDLVSHESTTTPLTIAICARWGRGKSVLLNYIKDRIDELVGTENFVDCVCIDFNAWKYTKSEQLWAEFYTKVLDGVESDLSWWGKTRFRAYFLRRNNPKLYYSTYWGAGFTVFTSFLLWYFYQQPLVLQFALKLQWGELISFWTPIAAFIATTFPFIWKRTRSVPKQIFWKSHLPKFKEALGVQHEIFKSFEIVCDWLGMPGKKRIVVFIDDIDRCEPDEILQVIESIKLLLDSENFVFILAMDPKIVRLAIGESYEFISKKKSDKERLGREYLEKIIQIPFHLPQLTYSELSRLKNQLFAVSESPDTFEGKGVVPQVTRDDPGEIQVDPELVTGREADDKLSPDKTPVISPIGDDSEPFDSKLSVEFSKSESSDIDLLLKDNFVISPRLLNRLKNAYLLAKHFYISEHNSDPPSELIKLLAFSIKYPFESVDIFETMEDESKNKYWASIANACYKQNDEEFNSNIYKMILMLKKHVPDIDVARNLSKYVNYFNITAS